MSDGEGEAKRLQGVTIIWLLGGVINTILIARLLLEPPAGAGLVVRIGLAGMGAALAFFVAAKFARQRQRVLEARPNGDRT